MPECMGRIIRLWICSLPWILFLIFEVILSLLALIFAYDTLAGEYERGTLRLVLTHPVGRGHILLAKYISAMLCLLVPLLMSLLLAVILLTTTPAISLNADDFLRIGGIIFNNRCVSFRILSHRHADFGGDASNTYRIDALHVRLGVFSPSSIRI